MSDGRTAVEKQERLFEALRDMGSAIVALSGGVDSAYLAWAAHHVLGERAIAVTGVSPSYPDVNRKMVEELVAKTGVRHEWIATHEMDVAGYVANAPNRCYFCKSELYSLLAGLRDERGVGAVCDGTNADDLGDHRPGRVAAEERGVRSPLVEFGFTKADIRELARLAGLGVWDAPASACLSSRIPHGTPVTIGRLSQVEKGEAALRRLGFRQMRVRHHDQIARVELGVDELPKALDPTMAAEIASALKAVGFRFVTLDLEGYRTGSMNA